MKGLHFDLGGGEGCVKMCHMATLKLGHSFTIKHRPSNYINPSSCEYKLYSNIFLAL